MSEANNSTELARPDMSAGQATVPLADVAVSPASTPVPAKKANKKPKKNALTLWPPSSLDGGMIGLPPYEEQPPPGWLPAGGGARRSQPEAVYPLKLPLKPLDDEDGSSQISSDTSDSEQSTTDADSDAASSSSQEERRQSRRQRREAAHRHKALLLSQSLRQSRLFHMSSMLPPFSWRSRSGISFPQSLPLEDLHGMDPSQKGTYVLTPLDRVELVIGPHIFAGIRILEMRKSHPPEYLQLQQEQSARGSNSIAETGPSKKMKEDKAKNDLQQQPVTAKNSPRPPPVNSTESVASRATTPTTTATPNIASPPTPPRSAPPAKAVQRPPPPRPPPPRPPTHSPRPPSAEATAAVDPVLVTRVNARAAHSPELRDLLQVAARGVATPEQLRFLGMIIQEVTKEMESEGLKVQSPLPARPPANDSTAPARPVPRPAPSAARPLPARPTNATAPDGPETKTAAAATPKPKKAKKKLSAVDASNPKQSTAEASKDVSPAAAAGPSTIVPTRPPCPAILLVEFRETPSMRYYLPVRSSLITRRRVRQPRIASDEGQGEELTEQPGVPEMVERVHLEMEFLAPVPGSDAARAEASTQYPIKLTITGGDPHGLLWSATDRLPAVKTLDEWGVVIPPLEPRDGGSVAEIDSANTALSTEGPAHTREKELSDEAKLSGIIAAAIANMPPRTELRLSSSSALPSGLEEHLADRFAPQRRRDGVVALDSVTTRPYKRKGGVKGRSKDVLPFANAFDSSFDAAGLHDDDQQITSTGDARPPRKKRHVATHNPDGTLKRCQHCDTTTTPMWRRGPEGPSTLCNRCGAKWKTGTLGQSASSSMRGQPRAIEGRSATDERED